MIYAVFNCYNFFIIKNAFLFSLDVQYSRSQAAHSASNETRREAERDLLRHRGTERYSAKDTFR